MLLEGPDFQHYFIRPGDLLDWRHKKTAVRPWSRDQLRAELKKEFGGGFYVEMTSHYAIVFNCDTALAQQAGTLLERAYSVFRAYFGNKGAFQFDNLRQPLVAVILKSKAEYLQATKEELGSTLAWSAGMYAPNTNRFYLYDANEGRTTGGPQIAMTPLRGASARGRSPLDQDMVTVIIHEGTHQLAFNFGIHVRHGFHPVWLVEGLATYFEAADAKSVEGWSRAGQLNPHRLAHLATILPKLKKGFLHRLTTNDELFYNTSTNGDAYALSWALTYYLMRAKQTSYIRYVRAVQARGLNPVDEKERLEDFRRGFQTTPTGLEDDFKRYMVGIIASASRANADR
jgi:hypothetical protein